MHTEPQKEHQWLQQLVGDWTMESECDMGPDQPKGRFKGRESVRPLGGLWILADGEGEMPGGGTGHMRLTLGFDPAKGHFVGSWVGSMMANMWVYDGRLDASGKVLSLDTTGPNCAPGSTGTAEYQERITIVGPDERTFASHMKGADGQWVQFMKATYRRVK